jgi:hypothetical protein
VPHALEPSIEFLEWHTMYGARKGGGNQSRRCASFSKVSDEHYTSSNLFAFPCHQGGDELVIELIEAKNLPAADRGGTSDPYAIIKYNGEVVQSRVVNKTLNPQWREVFILPLAPHPGERGSIRIDVYDKDFNLFGGKKSLGDFLGGVDVPVGVEPGGSASDQWLELGGEGGKGQVNVRLKGKRGKKTGVVEPVRVEVSMSRQKQVSVAGRIE